VKLLFDQNLPTRIVKSISDIFPKSQHIKSLGMSAATDQVIWRFASENGFAIISKDSDFHQMSFLYGAPPKTIWLRCGNCSVATLENIIRRNARKIEAFGEDEENALLVLDH
jgi:predicted nuclease of predicted toxin-antitoxin system